MHTRDSARGSGTGGESVRYASKGLVGGTMCLDFCAAMLSGSGTGMGVWLEGRKVRDCTRKMVCRHSRAHTVSRLQKGREMGWDGVGWGGMYQNPGAKGSNSRGRCARELCDGAFGILNHVEFWCLVRDGGPPWVLLLVGQRTLANGSKFWDSGLDQACRGLWVGSRPPVAPKQSTGSRDVTAAIPAIQAPLEAWHMCTAQPPNRLARG